MPNDDYNDYANVYGCFARYQLFQFPNGHRCSSQQAFIDTATDRLTLLTETTVLRILFESSKTPKAIGVVAQHNETVFEIRARREVIICAGIYSAELLQRSGIGPRALLESLQIPVIVDSPHVGRHSTNQPVVPVFVQIDPDDADLSDPHSICAGGAMMPPLLPEDDPYRRSYQIITQFTHNTLVLAIVYNQPRSEGKVQVQSKNPYRISAMDNNFFGCSVDLKAFIECLRRYILPLVDRLTERNPKYQLLEPSRDVIADDAQLTQYILNRFLPTHHWSCTNRMSESIQTGVVNEVGRVYGADGLRVVDCSIQPIITDGNTCSMAYTIAAVIGNEMLKQSVIPGVDELPIPE